MEIGELSVSFANVAAACGAASVVAWGVVKALGNAWAERIKALELFTKSAATSADFKLLQDRMNLVENRYHEEIRDLRREMNGLGQRLESAINAKLEPIQVMVQQLVTSLINNKKGD